MKLWLDDIRPCPDGYLHARSVNEAIKLLEQHNCEYASLDHDLGDFAEDGGDGYKLMLWMAEHDRWPIRGIPCAQCQRSRDATDVGRHRPLRPLPAQRRDRAHRLSDQTAGLPSAMRQPATERAKNSSCLR